MTRPLTQLFRDLYAVGGLWYKPLKFVWLWFLVWVEGHYLRLLTKKRLDEAVQDWQVNEDLANPTPLWRDVEIEATPSEIPGLPKLRIRAPWVGRE